MSGTPSIPPDPKTMAFLLKEFREDQKKVGKTLEGMSSTLGSIATSIKGLNKRVLLLEQYDRDDLKERAEATGAMDTDKQRAEAVALAQQVPQSTFPKELALKVLPWLIVAALSGASIGGFMMASAKADTLTKADIIEIISDSKKGALTPPTQGTKP